MQAKLRRAMHMNKYVQKLRIQFAKEEEEKKKKQEEEERLRLARVLNSVDLTFLTGADRMKESVQREQ